MAYEGVEIASLPATMYPYYVAFKFCIQVLTQACFHTFVPFVFSWRYWNTTWTVEEMCSSCSVKEEKWNMTPISTFSWKSLELWSTMVRSEICANDTSHHLCNCCVLTFYRIRCSPSTLQMQLWGMCTTNTSIQRRRLCPMVYWTGWLLQYMFYISHTYFFRVWLCIYRNIYSFIYFNCSCNFLPL